MNNEINSENIPLVSICMITYNQEPYISQAIDGVLMQKTNFPIELVIGEDCSKDNTRKICLEYKEKYPDQIKLLLPEKNLGMMPNAITTLQTCTGKYIAMCEGDDYWTDPYKLQKQVDFLEENEDFSICFHAVKIKKERENKIVDDFITPEVSDATDIYRLSHGNYIHTPSVLFRRNEEVFTSIAEFGSLIVGDYVLHMLNARYGKIKKLPETMAIYRAEIGDWSSKDSSHRLPHWLNMLEQLLVLFADDEKVTAILKHQYSVYLFTLYNIYKKEKDICKAKTLFMTTCANYPDLIYDEFNARDNEWYYLKKKKIYRVGILLLNPMSVLKKFKKMFKNGIHS